MANDFLIVSETANNQMSQADFSTNGQRVNGVQGIAISDLHNKIYHQSSFIANLIGQFISDAGYNASDVDSVQMLAYFKEAIMLNITEATETLQGIARIASNADMVAGTSDNSIVTPKKLKDNIQNVVPNATQTVYGKVRYATDAEAQAGVLNNVAITPKNLKDNIPEPPTATEGIAGGLRIGTQAEVDAGVLDNRIVTPLKYAVNIEKRLIPYAPLENPKFTGRPENTTPTTVYEESRITNTWISLNQPVNSQGRNGDVWYQIS